MSVRPDRSIHVVVLLGGGQLCRLGDQLGIKLLVQAGMQVAFVSGVIDIRDQLIQRPQPLPLGVIGDLPQQRQRRLLAAEATLHRDHDAEQAERDAEREVARGWRLAAERELAGIVTLQLLDLALQVLVNLAELVAPADRRHLTAPYRLMPAAVRATPTWTGTAPSGPI